MYLTASLPLSSPATLPWLSCLKAGFQSTTTKWWENSSTAALPRSSWASLGDKKLHLCQQCVLVAQKANSIVDCNKRAVGSREAIVLLYSAFMRPQLKYCESSCGVLAHLVAWKIMVILLLSRQLMAGHRNAGGLGSGWLLR